VSTISLELGVSSFLAREAIFPVSFSSRNFYLKATATYFSFTQKKEYKLLSDYHFIVHLLKPKNSLSATRPTGEAVQYGKRKFSFPLGRLSFVCLATEQRALLFSLKMAERHEGC
jgi:hypothetical protein